MIFWLFLLPLCISLYLYVNFLIYIYTFYFVIWLSAIEILNHNKIFCLIKLCLHTDTDLNRIIIRNYSRVDRLIENLYVYSFCHQRLFVVKKNSFQILMCLKMAICSINSLKVPVTLEGTLFNWTKNISTRDSENTWNLLWEYF